MYFAQDAQPSNTAPPTSAPAAASVAASVTATAPSKPPPPRQQQRAGRAVVPPYLNEWGVGVGGMKLYPESQVMQSFIPSPLEGREPIGNSFFAAARGHPVALEALHRLEKTFRVWNASFGERYEKDVPRASTLRECAHKPSRCVAPPHTLHTHTQTHTQSTLAPI